MLAIGVGAAAPAHADRTSYLNDLHNDGVTSIAGDNQLVAVGGEICSRLIMGIPTEQLNNQLWAIIFIDPAKGPTVVQYAHTDLCPDAR